MFINQINTKDLDITLLDRNINNSEVITYDDWLDTALDPLIENQVVKYSYVTCVFLISEATEEEAHTKISNIIAMSKISELEFEDLEKKYKGTLEKHEKEKQARGIYDLTLEWKCGHSFGDEVVKTLNRITSKTINVSGNLETPVIVEITPSIDLVDLTIQGLGEDITINNLTAGKKITIEDGLVLEEGINKFKDYDSWGFPKLNPGSNTITVDKSSCDITIKYKPRWI